MDMYRERFRQAQEYADRVLHIKKGHYLDDITAEAICEDETAYDPEIRYWSRLCSYRKMADENRQTQTQQLAVKEWLRQTVANGGSAAFALRCDGSELSVLYGASMQNYEAPLRTHLPECELRPAVPHEGSYRYNGLITGSILSQKIADLFAASNLRDTYIACLAMPVSPQEIQEKLEENRDMIAYFSTYKSFQRAYGNASRRIEEVPVPGVVQAIALLKEENDYLEHHMGGGFARTVVKFGANTAEDRSRLASLIRSCMECDRDLQSPAEPPRTFALHNPCDTWNDCLKVPSVQFGEAPENERVYLLTLQDIPGIASFCLPPACSCDGFYVKDYTVDEDAMDAFPVTNPVHAQGIELGTIANSSARSVIPFSALHSHAFVTGATETGKTTTVKKILLELHAAGIPFTVIEAAKKEYMPLISQVPELRVFTPGNDGNTLSFNPLQPEDGILIENHVAAVVRALTAAAGGEHPIPEACDGLLKQTYQQFGWKYGMMAYTDEHRPFPTFKNVLDNVDSYIAAHARYGPEVRQNLTAALTLRTETMHSGAMGSLFSNAKGLQAAEILAAPCVIELADFSPQSASFIMNILLYKFHSYLSRQPESSQLNQVIVVEEAHNVFKRTLSEENGRALSNEYFDKMLAEIRSSGTGLLLSDQRASLLSEAVMANTSVKILHALTDSEDRKTVGTSVNLSDFQLKKLAEFRPGECVVAIRGQHGVQHAQVTAPAGEQELHSACHICTTRFRCRRNAVKSMLAGMDSTRIAFHVSKIQAEPYNVALLERNITNMLRDLNVTASDATKICLLGEILDTYGRSSLQEKRIIVNSYAKYLRRREEHE